jgi:hypothetical protein
MRVLELLDRARGVVEGRLMLSLLYIHIIILLAIGHYLLIMPLCCSIPSGSASCTLRQWSRDVTCTLIVLLLSCTLPTMLILMIDSAHILMSQC